MNAQYTLRTTLSIAICAVTALVPSSAMAATAITHSISDRSLTYGEAATVSGTVTPAAAEAIVIESSTNGGKTFTSLVNGTSNPDGTFSIQASPARGGLIRVRTADSSAASTGITVTVAPRVTITKIGRGTTFVGAPISVTVAPSTYTGYVTLAAGRGSAAQSTRVRVRNGRVNATAPTPGVGRVGITVSTQAVAGLSSTSQKTAAQTSARALRSGSRGADVRALNTRLRSLGFKTPPASNRFDYRLADSVLAFHKSQGMRRTMSVSSSTWQALVSAKPLRARYRRAGTHLEVDKSKQIMMVVRDGSVLGALHVSTGATGNTPLGHFKVYQKGGSYLYKFMAFYGNFGTHGYPSVPATPASHGCVRQPNWIASWTFSKIKIGDSFYVYR